MILIEEGSVIGFEQAIRGMRNPMNSWDRSDSMFDGFFVELGDNDRKLALKLATNGSVHAKYRRMITVYTDITAPLYWWKEYDTYKVGTVANSCSTMHKIADHEFTLDDFSHDWLVANDDLCNVEYEWGKHGDIVPCTVLENVITSLNKCREAYLAETDAWFKKMWWYQMIQLLPSSYNQKRTVMLNYEVLAGIYKSRRGHKLDEWQKFCNWIEEELPYSELITAEVDVKLDTIGADDEQG